MQPQQGMYTSELLWHRAGIPAAKTQQLEGNRCWEPRVVRLGRYPHTLILEKAQWGKHRSQVKQHFACQGSSFHKYAQVSSPAGRGVGVCSLAPLAGSPSAWGTRGTQSHALHLLLLPWLQVAIAHLHSLLMQIKPWITQSPRLRLLLSQGSWEQVLVRATQMPPPCPGVDSSCVHFCKKHHPLPSTQNKTKPPPSVSFILLVSSVCS